MRNVWSPDDFWETLSLDRLSLDRQRALLAGERKQKPVDKVSIVDCQRINIRNSPGVFSCEQLPSKLYMRRWPPTETVTLLLA